MVKSKVVFAGMLIAFSLFLCTGCKDANDKELGLLANAPPTVIGIPGQTATVNYTFVFDLAGYVSDDLDSVGELTFAVISGGGSFAGSIYINTFTTPGPATVQFSVTDTGGLSGSGSFNVTVQDPSPTNNPPSISAIPDQNATEGTPFSLNLSAYVSDDHDAIGDLIFAVTGGGGSFTGATYDNTFTTAGSATVQFVVMDTGTMSATASFDVTVAPMLNTAPTVNTISDQTATVGYTFILDVSGYVADDHDADSDLTFTVDSGGGSFLGTVYANTFATTGLQAVHFTVTDTGTQSATGPVQRGCPGTGSDKPAADNQFHSRSGRN
jgi:hypothetical protein